VRSEQTSMSGPVLRDLEPSPEVVPLIRDDHEVAGASGPELIQQLVCRVGKGCIPGGQEPLPIAGTPVTANAQGIARQWLVADASSIPSH
jgi:hypothetical protein